MIIKNIRSWRTYRHGSEEYWSLVRDESAWSHETEHIEVGITIRFYVNNFDVTAVVRQNMNEWLSHYASKVTQLFQQISETNTLV